MTNPTLSFPLTLECLEDRCVPAILTVNSLADDGATTDELTLREAIVAVNTMTLPGGNQDNQIDGPLGTNDMIVFDPTLVGNTVTLNGTQLDTITRSVVIDGADQITGNARFEVDGADLSRVFEVNSGGTGLSVTFQNLTITRGNAINGAGINILDTTDTVLISNSSLTSNSATDFGGAIRSNGQLTIESSVISGNVATTTSGGGITVGTGTLTIRNNTIITDNESYSGGGIFSFGDVYIYDSQITMNRSTSASGSGGGLSTNSATVIIDNSTIADNSAVNKGGGISFVGGTSNVTIRNNSMITGNTANTAGGGGIYMDSATLSISDSTIDANTSYNGEGGGILSVSNGNTITVERSSITNNRADLNAGGGISFDGSLNISNSLVSGNQTTGAGAHRGGGIYARGDLNITDSLISGNRALSTNGDGGGIYVYNTGNATILNTSIVDNQANQEGGGFYVRGGNGNTPTVILSNSTISGNRTNVNSGGGLYIFEANATIVNTTVSGNYSFDEGGGIYVGGTTGTATITITNSTITGNTSGATGQGGGGLFALNNINAEINNSIIAGNSASGTPGNDIFDLNNILTGTNNIYSTGGLFGATLNNSTAVSNIDTVIGALADNGGPTQTHALIAGSAAIDQGNNTLAVDSMMNALTIDQRGVTRFLGNGTVDIGAVEYGIGQIITSPTNGSTVNSAFQVTLSNVFDLNALPTINTIENSLVITNGQLTNFVDNGNGTATATITPDGTGDVIIEAYNDSITISITGVSGEFTFTVGNSTFEAFYVTVNTGGVTPTIDDFTINGGIVRQVADNGDGTFNIIVAPNALGPVTLTSIFGVGEVSTVFDSLSFGSANEDFIRNLYTVIYARTPSDDEVAFWTAVIFQLR